VLGRLLSKTALGGMDARLTLTRVYLFVCRRYRGRLRAAAQRQSNNSQPDFTDEEVLAIYLFGIIKKRRTVSDIYSYVREHFSRWFPDLPGSCNGYRQRLNRLSAVFAPLVEVALEEIGGENADGRLTRIVDSIPIMMAKEKRSSQAKVAPDLANKGYCSSKGTFFYGVKLHVVGEHRPGALPVPRRAGLTPGSENDLVALRRVLPDIEGGRLVGDKAYCDGPMKKRLAAEQALDVYTPVKEKRGQESLSAADSLFSEAARQRQAADRVAVQLDR
jgi:uncharacterized protein YbaR (Trm112 family)